MAQGKGCRGSTGGFTNTTLATEQINLRQRLLQKIGRTVFY